jgi:hypothetical protein
VQPRPTPRTRRKLYGGFPWLASNRSSPPAPLVSKQPRNDRPIWETISRTAAGTVRLGYRPNAKVGSWLGGTSDGKEGYTTWRLKGVVPDDREDPNGSTLANFTAVQSAREAGLSPIPYWAAAIRGDIPSPFEEVPAVADVATADEVVVEPAPTTDGGDTDGVTATEVNSHQRSTPAPMPPPKVVPDVEIPPSEVKHEAPAPVAEEKESWAAAQERFLLDAARCRTLMAERAAAEALLAEANDALIAALASVRPATGLNATS